MPRSEGLALRPGHQLPGNSVTLKTEKHPSVQASLARQKTSGSGNFFVPRILEDSLASLEAYVE